MIRFDRVSKDYVNGENVVSALREVDFALGAGGYLSILGPSGSGKSTLLHVIGCLDTPTGGRYLLEGEDVSRLDVNRMAEVRNRRFGFVFQAFHLMPRSTAVQNVALPLRFAGVPAAERLARAAALLDRVGLSDRLDHRPSELSGGQQQRVAIARALANHPDVILADEPTGNLDAENSSQVLDQLRAFARDGGTVLAATHDPTVAAAADRSLTLRDGQLCTD